MGSGRARSNTASISAGSQVVTGDGGGAVGCSVDGLFAAVETPGAMRGEVGTLAIVDNRLALQLPSEILVLLVPNTATQRVMSCIARGYGFLGSVVDNRFVRIWNERS